MLVNREKFLNYVVNTIGNSGRAAEVGSYEGAFSKMILEKWNGFLYMVDVWTELDKAIYDDGSNQLEPNKTISKVFENIKGYEDRTVLLRTTSYEASKLIPDNSLDFVYIDANHAYKFVKNDIIYWWPKLRVGGIFSGHDYIKDYTLEKANESGDTPVWMNTEDGPFYCGMFGVNKAVDGFVKKKNLKLEVVDEYFGTWYITKEYE